MKNFPQELGAAGELVGAEGLAAPNQGKIVRGGNGGAPVACKGDCPLYVQLLRTSRNNREIRPTPAVNRHRPDSSLPRSSI